MNIHWGILCSLAIIASKRCVDVPVLVPVNFIVDACDSDYIPVYTGIPYK